MCRRILYTFDCGHTKHSWLHCRRATAEQRTRKSPCQQSTTQGRLREASNEHCCSTKCCQNDLDNCVQHLGRIERIYDIEKGRGWANRKVKQIDQFSPDWQAEPEASFLDAKANLMDAVHQHFFKCLRFLSRSRERNHRIDNSDLLDLRKPMYDPRPPRVPERPEINGLYKCALFSKVWSWKDSPPAMNDRTLFKQQLLADGPDQDISSSALTSSDSGVSIAELYNTENGILSEEKLIRIYLLLSDLLWYGQNTPVTQQIVHKLEILLVLQKHLEVAQPLVQNPLFHHLQYVMHIRRYDLFAKQMLDLRFWIRIQLEERYTDKRTHQFWTLVIENIYTRLEHLIVSYNTWLNDSRQPEDFRKAVQRLQDDTKQYREAQREWRASQKHSSKKKQRSDRSLSSLGPASVSSLSLDDAPLVEEPEPMQPERKNTRFGEPQQGKRARCDESTGSSWSSENRPPMRKKERQSAGKGKGMMTES